MRKLLLIIGFILLGAASSVGAQNTLNFGEAVTGSIGGGQLGVSYTFEAEAGDSIYVTMFAPNYDLDAEIQLTAPGGALLARQSSNNLTGALIGPLTLETSGTYTVLATAANDSSGDFNLLLDRGEWKPLQLGEPVSGAFPQAGSMAFYTFEGEAGKLIRYRFLAPNIGLAMVAPSGDVFAYSGIYDNLSSYFNILPETGVYQVALITTNPGGTAYDLTLSPVEAQPLSAGQSLTGTIRESDPQVFTFDSAAGKMWQLNAQVTDASNSSILQVFNGNDPSHSIADDRGSGPGGFPRIEPFIAPEDATYYVVLEFDDYSEDDAVRDYSVTVAPSSLLSLSPGQPVEAKVTPETGNVVYAYHGKAGEVVRVTLTGKGDTGAPGLTVWSQAQQTTLVDLSSYVRLRSTSIEVALPDDGMYLLTIRNQDSDLGDLDFTILVERVE